MLPPSSTLKTNIESLSPTQDKDQGVADLVQVIAAHVNQVQAGSLGTPGIFLLGNAAMEDILKDMEPVSDNSWINDFADAMEAGIVNGVITPGTVTNALWVGSGLLDVSTVPSASVTITTIAQAKSKLIQELQFATAGNNPPLPVAEAIQKAVLEFVFTCIGLASPPALTPIPLQFNAQ